MNPHKQILTLISLYALNACGSASDPGLQRSMPGAAGSTLVLEVAGNSSSSGGAAAMIDPSSGANSNAGTGRGGTNAADGGNRNEAGGGGGEDSGITSAGSAGRTVTGNGGSAGRTMTGNGGSAGRTMAGNGGSAAQSGAPSAAGSNSLCASADACSACVCRQCPTQVQTCEKTAGCSAIAECVRTSRCQGLACYCGSADALTCATGTANGPCRDVILAAPGGHKPSLSNQSAGPAADAATAVGNCGAKMDTGCVASCQ